MQESSLANRPAVDGMYSHAGRTTVESDDVMLIARRKEFLEDILRDCLAKMHPPKAEAALEKGDKRKGVTERS